MNDSEVHSLILERLENVEDDELRVFLHNVLRHERDIIKEPRAKYRERYENLVDGYVDNETLSDYDNE